MKINFKYVLLAAIALTLGGCSFLEEKSWDEVIPKTTEDFAELLVGSAYPITGDNNDVAAFTMLFDDDITLTAPSPTENDIIKLSAQASVYTWQPSTGVNTDAFSTIYYSYYTKIMGCNAVLDLIDDAIGLKADRDRVKAEALALRAYYYFMLVNFYGEPYNYEGEDHGKNSPGVPLKLNSVIDNEYPARNTVGEVYEQIVDDMTEAVRLMEPLDVIRGDFRFNRPAMHILLSRIYLHMEEWEKCIEQANEAIGAGSVLFDMTELGSIQSNDNSYYLYYQKNPELEWAFGSAPCLTMRGAADGLLSFNADILNEMFDPAMKANDARFIHGFLGNGLGDGQQIFISKFANHNDDNKHPMQSFRTAEAILNRAEAYAQSNHPDLAMEDYNTLRRNRIIGYTDDTGTYTKEQMIDLIRAERRREFCYEGFRWFDLRRYGMKRIVHRFAEQTGQIIYFVLEEKDPMYTLPLEASILQRNANLVQNPSGSAPDRLPTVNP